MRVIIHEAIGVDLDAVAVFIVKEEVVVELFGPGFFE